MNVAIGLSGIADWEASQPFLDAMRSSREWQGRSASQFTSHSNAQLRSGGHLDANGWPIRIPAGANRVGTIILCEIAAADTSLNGRYRMEWTGDGTLEFYGGRNLSRGTRWAEFDYAAGGGNMISVEMTAISATNPIKNITCVRNDRRAAYAAGEIFRPEWLDLVKGFRLFRFMDWQGTNNSKVSAWPTGRRSMPRPISAACLSRSWWHCATRSALPAGSAFRTLRLTTT